MDKNQNDITPSFDDQDDQLLLLNLFQHIFAMEDFCESALKYHEENICHKEE